MSSLPLYEGTGDAMDMDSLLRRLQTQYVQHRGREVPADLWLVVNYNLSCWLAINLYYRRP